MPLRFGADDLPPHAPQLNHPLNADAIPASSLSRRDFILLALFCLALFGYSMFSGRPLSLHEGRLPEVSREMMRNGNWLIPMSGGRPWLERPPLPHWMTIATSAVLGQHCDSVWVVRLPAAIAGVVAVLCTAWIAGRLSGRGIGLLSGLILATSYEFYEYSCLAEDDIYLAAIVTAAVALFVRMEFPGDTGIPPSEKHPHFFGARHWPLSAFFALLGLTNFAKGPLVGAAVVIAPLGAFLLLPLDFSRIRKYVWLWGWLAFAALTIAWPWAVYSKYTIEAIDNWKFDYTGTSEYDQPFWYYPIQLLGALAPWTPAVFVGLRQTAVCAFRDRTSAERFLWCWAIFPILVLSLPHRKHHHYLVPSLAPWAILCAIGLRTVARSMFAGTPWSRTPRFGLLFFGLPGAVAILLFHSKIPGPLPVTIFLAFGWLVCVGIFYMGLFRQDGRWVMGAVVIGLAVGFSWGQTFIPEQTTQDTIFLQRVESTVPRESPLFINSDLHGELDFFRTAFYLRGDARLLHNLTFLRDEKITAPAVYVVTREWDEPELAALGKVEIVLQSIKSRPSGRARKAKLAHERFTLYRLTFSPDLMRYPAPEHISTMQAMGRKPGPYCGPALR